MVKIELTNENLIVHITGVDVVLALRSTFTVPLKNVKGAVARPADAQYDKMKGIRVAGGYLPGSFAAGLFWVSGGPGEEVQAVHDTLVEAQTRLANVKEDPSGHFARAREHVSAAAGEVEVALRSQGIPEGKKHWAFYEVHDPEKAIGIDIEGQKVSRIVVQVDGETPEETVLRIEAAIAPFR